jgi:membrane fusion protein, copper/silver efflux system
MKRASCAIFLFLLLVASFLAGSWHHQRAGTGNTASVGRKILYYVDPMHPAYKSDKPGIAPDCGMELVPVYEDGSTGSAGSSASGPPGTVNLSSEKQQLIGVKVASVDKASRNHTIRVLGRVVPDETRIYRINAATDGWIRKILPVTTDSLISKDDLLATFYAPEFFSAMKAYLYGLRSLDRFEASRKETKEQIESTNANIENYRNSLRNLGMTEHQLDEIMHTRQSADNIEIRAPAAGFVLIRNVSLGQRFEKGTELYRIADLSQVWIVADTFDKEASALKPGMAVRVSAPPLTKTISARVAHVSPRFDPASRTLQVRLEADNPGLVLRPDMFVDLELPINYPSAIVVPSDAVVDSGVKQTVYVAKGDGVFEPRKVETGWRHGDRVEIVKGLMPGERIVVAGTFLIDSESRMKAAAAGIYGETAEDPACGIVVDIGKVQATGRTATYQGEIYYFSSDDCKAKFAKEPTHYTGKAGKGATTETGKKVEWTEGKAHEPEHHEHSHP